VKRRPGLAKDYRVKAAEAELAARAGAAGSIDGSWVRLGAAAALGAIALVGLRSLGRK
jgi:hypothetical protein